jgi:hypothetical protein
MNFYNTEELKSYEKSKLATALKDTEILTKNSTSSVEIKPKTLLNFMKVFSNEIKDFIESNNSKYPQMIALFNDMFSKMKEFNLPTVTVDSYLGKGYKKLEQIAKTKKKIDILDMVKDNFVYKPFVEGPYIPTPDESKPEMHIPGYNFLGPGTQVEARVKRGDRGINALDEAARIHDIEQMAFIDNYRLKKESDDKFAKTIVSIIKAYSVFLNKKIAQQKLEKIGTFSPLGTLTKTLNEKYYISFDIGNELFWAGLVKDILDNKSTDFLGDLMLKLGYNERPHDFTFNHDPIPNKNQIQQIGNLLIKIAKNKITLDQVEMIENAIKSEPKSQTILTNLLRNEQKVNENSLTDDILKRIYDEKNKFNLKLTESKENILNNRFIPESKGFTNRKRLNHTEIEIIDRKDKKINLISDKYIYEKPKQIEIPKQPEIQKETEKTYNKVQMNDSINDFITRRNASLTFPFDEMFINEVYDIIDDKVNGEINNKKKKSILLINRIVTKILKDEDYFKRVQENVEKSNPQVKIAKEKYIASIASKKIEKIKAEKQFENSEFMLKIESQLYQNKLGMVDSTSQAVKGGMNAILGGIEAAMTFNVGGLVDGLLDMSDGILKSVIISKFGDTLNDIKNQNQNAYTKIIEMVASETLEEVKTSIILYGEGLSGVSFEDLEWGKMFNKDNYFLDELNEAMLKYTTGYNILSKNYYKVSKLYEIAAVMYKSVFQILSKDLELAAKENNIILNDKKIIKTSKELFNQPIIKENKEKIEELIDLFKLLDIRDSFGDLIETHSIVNTNINHKTNENVKILWSYFVKEIGNPKVKDDKENIIIILTYIILLVEDSKPYIFDAKENQLFKIENVIKKHPGLLKTSIPLVIRAVIVALYMDAYISRVTSVLFKVLNKQVYGKIVKLNSEELIKFLSEYDWEKYNKVKESKTIGKFELKEYNELAAIRKDIISTRSLKTLISNETYEDELKDGGNTDIDINGKITAINIGITKLNEFIEHDNDKKSDKEILKMINKKLEQFIEENKVEHEEIGKSLKKYREKIYKDGYEAFKNQEYYEQILHEYDLRVEDGGKMIKYDILSPQKFRNVFIYGITWDFGIIIESNKKFSEKALVNFQIKDRTKVEINEDFLKIYLIDYSLFNGIIRYMCIANYIIFDDWSPLKKHFENDEHTNYLCYQTVKENVHFKTELEIMLNLFMEAIGTNSYKINWESEKNNVKRDEVLKYINRIESLGVVISYVNFIIKEDIEKIIGLLDDVQIFKGMRIIRCVKNRLLLVDYGENRN